MSDNVGEVLIQLERVLHRLNELRDRRGTDYTSAEWIL